MQSFRSIFRPKGKGDNGGNANPSAIRVNSVAAERKSKKSKPIGNGDTPATGRSKAFSKTSASSTGAGPDRKNRSRGSSVKTAAAAADPSAAPNEQRAGRTSSPRKSLSRKSSSKTNPPSNAKPPETAPSPSSKKKKKSAKTVAVAGEDSGGSGKRCAKVSTAVVMDGSVRTNGASNRPRHQTQRQLSAASIATTSTAATRVRGSHGPQHSPTKSASLSKPPDSDSVNDAEADATRKTPPSAENQSTSVNTTDNSSSRRKKQVAFQLDDDDNPSNSNRTMATNIVNSTSTHSATKSIMKKSSVRQTPKRSTTETNSKGSNDDRSQAGMSPVVQPISIRSPESSFHACYFPYGVDKTVAMKLQTIGSLPMQDPAEDPREQPGVGTLDEHETTKGHSENTETPPSTARSAKPTMAVTGHNSQSSGSGHSTVSPMSASQSSKLVAPMPSPLPNLAPPWIPHGNDNSVSARGTSRNKKFPSSDASLASTGSSVLTGMSNLTPLEELARMRTVVATISNYGDLETFVMQSEQQTANLQAHCEKYRTKCRNALKQAKLAKEKLYRQQQETMEVQKIVHDKSQQISSLEQQLAVAKNSVEWMQRQIQDREARHQREMAFLKERLQRYEGVEEMPDFVTKQEATDNAIDGTTVQKELLKPVDQRSKDAPARSEKTAMESHTTG